MRYAFLRTQEGTHRIIRLCAALGVSRSGYYAWRDRPVSARTAADQRLLPMLQRLHHQTREAYGTLRLWRALTRRWISCGRHRVARGARRGAGRAR